jgi:hypothetical protein
MGVSSLLLGAVLLAPPSVDDVRTATREVLSDVRWQRDLPPIDDADPPAPTGAREGSGRRLRRGQVPEGTPRDVDRRDGSAQLPPWVGLVFGWFALAGIAALVVVGVVQAIRSRSPGHARAPGEAGAPPPAAAAAAERARAATLAEADALAAAGRYEEALHVLLHRTFATLTAAGRADAAAPALTSREVLARARLDGDDRGALEGLVGVVEVTRFGGAPADEAAWREGRARFRRLAGPAGVA